MEARLRGVDLTASDHIHSSAAAVLFTGHLWNERMIRFASAELVARAASAAHQQVDMRAEQNTLREMRDALQARFALRKDDEAKSGPKGLPPRTSALGVYLTWVEEARAGLPPDSDTAKDLDRTINDIKAMIEQVG